MSFEEIVDQLKAELGEETIASIEENSSPKAIVIKKEDLLKVMSSLHEKEGLYFDSLSCVTGLDNGPEAGTMEMIYNLYSIPYNHHLAVKVVLDRTAPVIASLAGIWRTADWQEREVFDLLGIDFEGHPDLRRILLPADWEGHPLRKDYEHQEYYRGVQVKY